MADLTDLGTMYADDNLRLELRITGVGCLSLAVQGPPSWEWTILRTWVQPDNPTDEQLDSILVALGREGRSG